MYLESAGVTYAGRRPHNEDAWVARPDLGLFVVADGMGGYEGGEVASHCVVEAFTAFAERVARDTEATWPHRPLPHRSREEDLLANCTLLAQRSLLAQRTGPLRHMGSTVVALAFGQPGAAVAHVGDSRLYRLRGGRLEALTRDHSVLEEMREAGQETPSRRESPFGHYITRALGTERAEPSLQRLEVLPGDVYLLCSDGLYEPLEPQQLVAELSAKSAIMAAQGLVSSAYEAGSRDNITALVVRAHATSQG